MARIEPPATLAAASCMPAKAGSSPGPIPASGGSLGSAEKRRTAAM